MKAISIQSWLNLTGTCKNRLSAIGGSVLISMLVSSCAIFSESDEEVAVVEAKPELQSVWPAPPQQARIRYLGSLKSRKGGSDKKLSFSDVLLGKKQVDDVNILTKPYGVHSNSNGKVFVTDTGKSGLVVFDLKQNSLSYWGKSGPGLLKGPLGVTSDAQGNVYVSDNIDKRVVIFDKDGNYQNAYGGKDVLANPTGLVFIDDSQLLYVVDVKKHQIIVFNTEGEVEFTIGERGNEPGQFNFPTNISQDAKNSLLLVADSMNFRVQVFKADGTFVKTFGKNGNGPGDFSRLKGIGVDTEGHIYAVDAAFNNFQIMNQQGQLLLAVGRASLESDGFYLPAGLHVDRKNHIFVADQHNRRIQMFEFIGEQE
ncbi:MAG: 6-bladed beta-propeller [Gammaproteobacteria bacterium]|nr:6-bladed beta-propeller [Gammaproteobacteria bacterium]